MAELRERRTCANISAALKITQADNNAKLGRDSWKNIFFFLLKSSGVKDGIVMRVTPGNKWSSQSVKNILLILQRYAIIPSDTSLGGGGGGAWCVWEMTALCGSESQMLGTGTRLVQTGDGRQPAPSPDGRCECLRVNQPRLMQQSSRAGYTLNGNTFWAHISKSWLSTTCTRVSAPT